MFWLWSLLCLCDVFRALIIIPLLFVLALDIFTQRLAVNYITTCIYKYHRSSNVVRTRLLNCSGWAGGSEWQVHSDESPPKRLPPILQRHGAVAASWLLKPQPCALPRQRHRPRLPFPQPARARQRRRSALIWAEWLAGWFIGRVSEWVLEPRDRSRH